MHEGKPTPDEDGVTLSPDAPIGEPVPDKPERPLREPAPGDDGVIAPGSTPESR